MKSEIKKKVKAGKRLSKAQIEYIRENMDPDFKVRCGPCRFNLMVYVGLDPFSKTRR